MIDEVELDGPQSFGTALITFSKWKQVAPDRLLVGEGPAAVQVDLACDAGDVRIEAEPIPEDLPGDRVPIRLGIDLAEPAAKATIRLTITPTP